MMDSRGFTLIIIGGVAGGVSAAAKARRMNEAAEITIFDKGPYVSFANCGLPYYVGNTIQDREDLLLQSPERLWQRFRVRAHVLHEVLHINRTEKYVQVKDLVHQRLFSQFYDKLSWRLGPEP